MEIILLAAATLAAIVALPYVLAAFLRALERA